jgi:hypothetical protein
MEQLNTREELLEVVRGLRADLDLAIAEAEAERMEQPGSFGEWSFKDLIAHLTGWRLVTAARLEAGQRHEEPVFPWPAQFDEADDLHEINVWFYETNRDKPLADVLRESNETFERVEIALATMPEDDLLTPGRFAWLYWTSTALGPAVIRGTQNHYRREHEPAIKHWLARQTSTQRVLTEDEAFRLLAHLIATAELHTIEPPHYAGHRMVEATLPLLDAMIRDGDEQSRQWLQGFKQQLEDALAARRSGTTYEDFLHEAPGEITREIKRRRGPAASEDGGDGIA